MREELLIYARMLLDRMPEKDAMDRIKARGYAPGAAYLAVKAGKILRERYTYKEARDRQVRYEDV
jgi:hypothetical protein